MSPPFHPRTQLALLAVVSALIILRVAKRAPKKPLLLTDLKDAASKLTAGGVLADPEYDIIIVGGGEFPLSLSVSVPYSLQGPRAVFLPLVSPRSPVYGCCWSSLGKGIIDLSL